MCVCTLSLSLSPELRLRSERSAGCLQAGGSHRRPSAPASSLRRLLAFCSSFKNSLCFLQSLAHLTAPTITATGPKGLPEVALRLFSNVFFFFFCVGTVRRAVADLRLAALRGARSRISCGVSCHLSLLRRSARPPGCLAWVRDAGGATKPLRLPGCRRSCWRPSAPARSRYLYGCVVCVMCWVLPTFGGRARLPRLTAGG